MEFLEVDGPLRLCCAQVIVITNEKGAQLELSGKQVGLQVNADLSGTAVTVK